MPILILTNTVTVELDSVWRGLLTLAGVAALVVLTIVFSKLVGTVSRLNRMLDEVTPDIKETVSKLPETMQNVNDVSGNIVDLTDDVVAEFPQVISSVSQMTETASGLFDSAASVVTEITLILTSILRFLKKPLATASVVRDVMHGAGKFKRRRKKK